MTDLQKPALGWIFVRDENGCWLSQISFKAALISIISLSRNQMGTKALTQTKICQGSFTC